MSLDVSLEGKPWAKEKHDWQYFTETKRYNKKEHLVYKWRVCKKCKQFEELPNPNLI